MDLAHGRAQKIGAAQHLGDSLFGVVDHDRELVGKQAVSAAHDEVPDLALEVLAHAALNPVQKGDSLGGDSHARGAGCSSAGQAVAAGAGIDDFAFADNRGVGDLLARAGTGKQNAARLQHLQRAQVRGVAPALAHDGALPLEAEPLEREQNRVNRARHRARPVQVLHAYQPLAVPGARLAIAGKGGDQRAEMQRAGGRGGEAAAVDGHGCVIRGWSRPYNAVHRAA